MRTSLQKHEKHPFSLINIQSVGVSDLHHSLFLFGAIMTEEELMERDLSIIRSHTIQLMEHFDAVQIFCNRYDSQEQATIKVQYGHGNWFARYGQVSKWLIEEEESSDD